LNLGLTGRTAIVCGASAGMGLATAEALERESERIGGLAVRGDVRMPRDLEQVVERTLAAFGGIDILVNNSGGPPRGTALDADSDAVESAVELLLLSVVRLTHLCLPHLERSGHGRVINITSSSVREPIDGLALSNTVRPGVIGWAKTLAREVGPRGITVNSIAPEGPSEADLEAIPLRRLGAAREVGDVICFLASDRGSYVTGTVIPVDGGLSRGLL
jgi:3-oxoacyl-[acyl-carrier protein] reductase